MDFGGNPACQDYVERMVNLPEQLRGSVFSLCAVSKRNTSFYKACCGKTLEHSEGSSPSVFIDRFTDQLCSNFSSNFSQYDAMTEPMRSYYDEFCTPDIDNRNNPYKEYTIVIYLLLSILSPIGLTANTLIMLTVYKVKRLRNTTGYFICNLAFADVLVIIEMLLYTILSKADVMRSTRVRKYIFPTFDVFLGSASLLLVTAVSVERGIAVARPLKYPRYLSERRAKILVVCIWIYCFVMFFLGVLRIWILNKYYEKIYFYVTVTLSFFVPCVFVVSSYNVIVCSALKTMKMEKKICKVIVAISLMNDQRLDKVAVKPTRCRELKVAVKVATLTIPFICGWGYFMICNVYEATTGSHLRGVANLLIVFLPYIVSCLNPLTYLMFTRTLRQSSCMILSRSNACMKIFKLICMKKKEPVIRARLVPRDRLKQMQFTTEHSKLLAAKHVQHTKLAQTVI